MERYKITTDGSHLRQVNNFLETYDKPLFNNFIKKYVAVSLADKNGKIASVVLRCLIETNEKDSINQNYIVGLRFYDFGKIATIDFISSSEKDHNRICFNHLKAMRWPIINGRRTNSANYFDEETISPLVFCCGSLSRRYEFGILANRNEQILFLKSFDLAYYCLFLNELAEPIDQEENDPIQELLEFMLDFSDEGYYERVIEETFVNTPIGQKVLSEQQLGSILMMKSIDWLENENKEASVQNIIEKNKIKNNYLKNMARLKK